MTTSAQKLGVMCFDKRSDKTSFPECSWARSPRDHPAWARVLRDPGRSCQRRMWGDTLLPQTAGHPLSLLPFGVTLLREDMRWQQHFSYGGCERRPGQRCPRTAPHIPLSALQHLHRAAGSIPMGLSLASLGCPLGWGQVCQCQAPSRSPGSTRSTCTPAHY